MSAVKYSVHFCKLLCCLNDYRLFVFGMLTVLFHHMESGDDIIGFIAEKLPVPVKYIEDTVMGTARKEPAPAVLCDDKALFMRKII